MVIIYSFLIISALAVHISDVSLEDFEKETIERFRTFEGLQSDRYIASE